MRRTIELTIIESQPFRQAFKIEGLVQIMGERKGRQEELGANQDYPSTPLVVVAEIVSLAGPQHQKGAGTAGNGLEIHDLHARALGDADQHEKLIAVGPAHGHGSRPPLEVGHAEHFEIERVGICRAIAQVLDVDLSRLDHDERRAPCLLPYRS